MEGCSSQPSPASAEHEKEFVWDPSIMKIKLNVKIGDAEYYHPFPTRTDCSPCWNFFRCKLHVDYKSSQDVYCLRCCKKMKSKPGEPIKYSFLTLKLNFRHGTTHLMKYINQHHAADLKSDQESVSVTHHQRNK